MTTIAARPNPFAYLSLLRPYKLSTPRPALGLSDVPLTPQLRQLTKIGALTGAEAQRFAVFAASDAVAARGGDKFDYIASRVSGGVPAFSAAQAAEIGQRAIDNIRASQEGISRAVSRLNDFKFKADLLDIATKTFGEVRAREIVDRFFNESLIDGLNRARGGVAQAEGTLRQVFQVEGDVVRERPDGNFDLGSFTATYGGGSVVLYTSDRAPPAAGANAIVVAVDRAAASSPAPAAAPSNDPLPAPTSLAAPLDIQV